MGPTLVCPKCDHGNVTGANFCAHCGWKFASQGNASSEAIAGTEAVEGRTLLVPRQPLSVPLHIFGVLLLLPTAFAILNLGDLLDPLSFGFGLNLPTGSHVLLFSESTLALISLFLIVGTLAALYGRKSGLRKFAIASLVVVPLRFLLQVAIAIELSDEQLAEVAVPGLFVTTAMSIIWIPYFLLSKRVKEIVSHA